MPETFSLPDVPFDDVAGFTRKLIHDVRNGLNALDLQLASTLDLADETASPLREDITLARRLLSNEARRLTQLSAQLRGGSPQIIAYRASDLAEDLRGRLERAVPEAVALLDWSVDDSEQPVSVDFELLAAAMAELLKNAVQFREDESRFAIRAIVEGAFFLVELTEHRSKVESDPSTWGVVPFQSTRRGAYGLGLFSARRAMATLGGELEMRHDAERSELCSRLVLPLSTP